MKWDYSSISVWGLDEQCLDTQFLGKTRFEKSVVELAQKLHGGIEQGRPLDGYLDSYIVVRDGVRLVACFNGGTGGAKGSSHFECKSTAGEVYPLLQVMYPHHSVSRLDAAEDFTGQGAYGFLESMLTKVCSRHNVSMAPFGEGHVRPDGRRDTLKGRTWYCGSKNSVFRIVLYEKGKEQLGKGVVADPNWVRLEARVRPVSKSKWSLGHPNLKPIDLLGCSRWGMEVAEYLGVADIQRLSMGGVWNPREEERLADKIVRMFPVAVADLVSTKDAAEIGELLRAAVARQQEVKALIEA